MLKVAAIQFNPKFLDLKENRRKISQLIDEVIVKYSPKLIVLPELAFSGYNFENISQVEKTSETIPNSDSCRLLEQLSIENKVYIVAGINENFQGRYYNSAVVYGPNGYILTYRKLQLYAREKLFFQPGNLPLQVFNIENYKVGVMICFDWFFPEIPRTLALMGANIICHVMNAVIPDGAYIGDTYHCKWNRVFIILANRVGKERDLTFIGKSVIINHEGKILKQASEDQEEIIVADIEPLLAINKKLNAFNDVIADRRPEFYKI
ncbi:MAG: nitrilase-related carbon-nitrogen hydrolase [Candidatus Helarchaeota archaeon]